MNELPAFCKFAMRPWRMMCLVLGLTFACETAIMLVLPQTLSNTLGKPGVALLDAFILTVLLVPCVWRLVVTPVRRLADCRQLLLNWALTAEERKTRQLARELHDGIGQLISAINLGLKSLEARVQDPQVIQHAQELREIGRQLHHDLRMLSRGLRPRVLDDVGLAAAITTYVSESAAQSDLSVTADVSDIETERFSEGTETALYRVMQEAVTNALRHGKPQHVKIQVQVVDDRLELTVADDGEGFDLASVFHRYRTGEPPFGLISIKERIDLLGGETQITSRAGHGTCIWVRLPVTARNENDDEDSRADRR